MKPMDGNAIVYCQGAYNTPNGKTAHGLVRFTRRYEVLSVVDSSYTGKDAGQVLDGTAKGIPIYASIKEAFNASAATPNKATHLVVGLAPDGGRLSDTARFDIRVALSMGLNIDSGLHDFLSEDKTLSELAARNALTIRDVRKPPPIGQLHFFCGKIEAVTAFKIAVLGTDSAVGKRTTAWLLVQAFEAAGFRAEMIGTGQTAWMQGAEHGVIMDALINDFVAGEIEHAVHSAWEAAHPDVIVIEGQGSLMNPAYPGGFEILAAGRPDLIILQHAPARKDYDGFPGYPIHPLSRQIQMLEGLSGKPVAAITVNHEGLHQDRIDRECKVIRIATGLPTFDVLKNGAGDLIRILIPHLQTAKKEKVSRDGKN